LRKFGVRLDLDQDRRTGIKSVPPLSVVHRVSPKIGLDAPQAPLFGGFRAHDWPGRMVEGVNVVRRIKTLGGTADSIDLPDASIWGNSHMLMMDVNNQEIAVMMLDRVNRNASARRLGGR
jgi:hypothetical protein